MKKSLILLASMIFSLCTYAQVAYIQYRVVPNDREAEFVEKETKYWSKVAKSAIDQGHMTGWSLWRKVGVTNSDAPNYVFVNNYESLDKMDPSKVWSEENLKTMGMDPAEVETNSFTSVYMDYYMQLEDMVQGDYDYAIVNYAMPTSRSAFIEENKKLWKPLHEKNIKAGNMGMTAWGVMSTIYPTGNEGRFSCMTFDGFNTLKDALKYMSYQSPEQADTGSWAEVMEKTKMDEILPDGFEYRIIYQRVISHSANDN